MISTTFTPKEIVWNGLTPKFKPTITVKAGVTLVKGTVVGKVTATGFYAAYDNAATDGTEVAAGILATHVDTATTNLNQATEARIYRGMGVLLTDQLVGMDAKALQDLGAYEMAGNNATVLVGPAPRVAQTVSSPVDGDVTLGIGDAVLVMATSASARTVNLPAAAAFGAGNTLIICGPSNANTYNVTVDGAASETINGATTATISTAYGALSLMCTGTGWRLF